MTTRKRNEFLDPLLSDDDEASEDAGYDSEAAEESKGRTVKRRRREADDESDDGQSDDNEDGEEDNEEDEEEEAKPSKSKGTSTAEPKPKPKAIAKAQTETKKNKTGVIYLSTLPPYLKPSALKSMLEQRGFGPITRIFLTPYTPPAGAPRRRSNKRKSYTDGWVEFARKRTAKICAQTLNASIVGGKKGGWYHDDVWNMKYLRGFKWGDLMEQVQRERGERDAKRRIEDSRARREDRVFLEGVEKGRVVEGIKKKSLEKGRAGEQEVRRVFRQNEVRGDAGEDEAEGDGLDEGAKRVLGKIF